MNRKLHIILFILTQCFVLNFAQVKNKDLPTLKKKAENAYYAKNYEESANYFSQIASVTKAAPDYYNTACVLSLAEKKEEAISMIQKAVDSGYKNYSNLSRDSDLDYIRSDSRFALLLKRLEKYDRITESTSDPEAAKVIYDDVQNFVRAFKMLSSNQDTAAILQKEYIAKGTPGLKMFIDKYGLSAKQLAQKIQEYPEDYSGIEAKLEWLKSREPVLRKYFKKLNTFIPMAIYPPTYFLVDRRRGMASGSIEGQLVTIEKKAADTVDVGIEGTIIHELVHLNQLHVIGSLNKYLAIYNDEKSLLAIAIREGIATYFAHLVTGEGKTAQRKYINRNEMEIWRRFETDMHGRETKDWVFGRQIYPDQPHDLAYVIGEKIVEYYYTHSLDLEIAVKEILAVTKYREFLEKSNYSNKFKK
jgi:tetratricopeptide (TPR) repeat protein